MKRNISPLLLCMLIDFLALFNPWKNSLNMQSINSCRVPKESVSGRITNVVSGLAYTFPVHFLLSMICIEGKEVYSAFVAIQMLIYNIVWENAVDLLNATFLAC